MPDTIQAPRNDCCPCSPLVLEARGCASSTSEVATAREAGAEQQSLEVKEETNELAKPFFADSMTARHLHGPECHVPVMMAARNAALLCAKLWFQRHHTVARWQAIHITPESICMYDIYTHTCTCACTHTQYTGNRILILYNGTCKECKKLCIYKNISQDLTNISD